MAVREICPTTCAIFARRMLMQSRSSVAMAIGGVTDRLLFR